MGWISRNNLDPPVKAELFFLTSLFIELIDPAANIPALIRPHVSFAHSRQEILPFLLLTQYGAAREWVGQNQISATDVNGVCLFAQCTGSSLFRVSVTLAKLDVEADHRAVNVDAIVADAPVWLTVAFG